MNAPQESTPTPRRPGFSRLKKINPKIDMTPMVDLGFLLISFFVITTQLMEKKATELIMPTEGTPTELGMSYALTVMPVGNNKIYYYNGDWETAQRTASIYETSYAGKNSLRDIIINKQMALDLSRPGKEGKEGLMLLIKPSTEASYKNVVAILDETLINDVSKKALLPLNKEEEAWLKNQ